MFPPTRSVAPATVAAPLCVMALAPASTERSPVAVTTPRSVARVLTSAMSAPSAVIVPVSALPALSRVMFPPTRSVAPATITTAAAVSVSGPPAWIVRLPVVTTFPNASPSTSLTVMEAAVPDRSSKSLSEPRVTFPVALTATSPADSVPAVWAMEAPVMVRALTLIALSSEMAPAASRINDPLAAVAVPPTVMPPSASSVRLLAPAQRMSAPESQVMSPTSGSGEVVVTTRFPVPRKAEMSSA